jgi:hypothetical protein
VYNLCADTWLLPEFNSVFVHNPVGPDDEAVLMMMMVMMTACSAPIRTTM